MKRHDALIKLSREHHTGLILSQLIKKSSPAYVGLPSDEEGKRIYTLNAYDNELREHFRKEEEILIPLISGKHEGVDRITTEVVRQHRQIENLIDQLRSPGETELILDELGNLLGDHIRLEEREWFEKIQRLFSDEELGKIVKAFED